LFRAMKMRISAGVKPFMNIRFDEGACRDTRGALKLEWLETNGLGGYASSTILLCHTRRYHGLLVSNLARPSGRFVLLSKFEDSVFSSEEEIFLSCHLYPGVFFPSGGTWLDDFEIDYCPRFTYRVGEGILQKRIMLVHGEDRVLIRYRYEGPSSLGLRIKPFLAFRGHHELSRENSWLRERTCEIDKGFTMEPYDGMPPLFIQANRPAVFSPLPLWYRNFEYPMDAERGLDFQEDLFHPGILEVALDKGEDVILSGSLKENRERLESLWAREEARRKGEVSACVKILRNFKNGTVRSAAEVLIQSGRHFLMTTPSKRPGIIAGYHWFYLWGRDTLISLPGLTFCSGRSQEGIDILKAVGGLEKKGLLPNCLAEDEDQIAYNSVDSALWFFWAAQQMVKYTGDMTTLKNDLWPVMKRILEQYMEGTDNRIFMAENGLLHAGDEGMQLTWMDVSIEGTPVTPRSGHAVDINALWFNALRFAHELEGTFGDREMNLSGLIEKVRLSFNRTFWVEGGMYLGDVFSNGRLDTSVRPNQILAVSLPHSPLEPDRWRGVVEKVSKELFTPVGLRTLSAADRNYKSHYTGGPVERDLAYHQGTVWPWLLGHYGEACLRVAEDKTAVREFLLEIISKSMNKHFREAGLGFVSEVFDGDPPRRPGGCIAQAWSSAELIRLMRVMSEIP